MKIAMDADYGLNSSVWKAMNCSYSNSFQTFSSASYSNGSRTVASRRKQNVGMWSVDGGQIEVGIVSGVATSTTLVAWRVS